MLVFLEEFLDSVLNGDDMMMMMMKMIIEIFVYNIEAVW